MNVPLGVPSINPRLHCASAAIASTWNTAPASLILRLPLSSSLAPAARQAAADWQEKQSQRQQQQQQHPLLSLALLLFFLSSPLRLSLIALLPLILPSLSVLLPSLSRLPTGLSHHCAVQWWCKKEWKTKRTTLRKSRAEYSSNDPNLPSVRVLTYTPNKS